MVKAETNDFCRNFSECCFKCLFWGLICSGSVLVYYYNEQVGHFKPYFAHQSKSPPPQLFLLLIHVIALLFLKYIIL